MSEFAQLFLKRQQDEVDKYLIPNDCYPQCRTFPLPTAPLPEGETLNPRSSQFAKRGRQGDDAREVRDKLAVL